MSCCAPACFSAPALACCFPAPAACAAGGSTNASGRQRLDELSGKKAPALSVRGSSHASKVTPFWDTFDRMLADPYDRDSNPSGYVNMGIANNYLMERELLDFMPRALRQSMHFTDLTYGTSLYGSQRLFYALCKHYNRPAFNPHLKVRPEHIVTGPGCGSLLDQIFEHIADVDDGVLIAAPYYNGFDADLQTRSKVHGVPVFSPHGDGTEAAWYEGETALDGFEKRKSDWEKESGAKIRAVIVCNPHNPVGRCYDRQALLAYGRFAEKHDLHLVFDEIYSLSTFESDGSQQPFISALSIDFSTVCHPARVHVLSSSSKDFGLNGYRVGTCVSQHNPQLLAALKMTAKLNMVGSPSDALFSALLCHDGFFEALIRCNRARLSQAYATVKAWCEYHDIRQTPSAAGHFCLVDLGFAMPSEMEGRKLTPEESEATLWAKVLERRVCITPGSNYHHPHNGTFRLTFSLRPHALREGLRRLEEALGLPAWSGPSGEVVEPVLDMTDEAIEAGLVKVGQLFTKLGKAPTDEVQLEEEGGRDAQPANARAAVSRDIQRSIAMGAQCKETIEKGVGTACAV